MNKIKYYWRKFYFSIFTPKQILREVDVVFDLKTTNGYNILSKVKTLIEDRDKGYICDYGWEGRMDLLHSVKFDYNDILSKEAKKILLRYKKKGVFMKFNGACITGKHIVDCVWYLDGAKFDDLCYDEWVELNEKREKHKNKD